MPSLRVFFTPVPSNLGTRYSEQTNLSHLWQRYVVFLSSRFGGKACIWLVDLFIKRSLGCPIAGVALVTFSESSFETYIVPSMLVDKEMLMHQLSVVRFLSEGEGREVILWTTPSEEHLNMHGSSRLFFHWQQQAYCCYHCDRQYLQIIFLLA